MENSSPSKENNLNSYSNKKNDFGEELENNPNQNLRSRQSLQMQSAHNQDNSYQRDIARVNSDLRFAGFNTLESLSTCTNQQADEILKVVYELLWSRDREKAKAKQYQTQLHYLQNQNKRHESKLEMLTDQISHLQKQRERNIEKVKQLERDFKDKEDKYIKEKVNYQRQKRAVQTREVVIKNQFKKKDDKIFQLEAKLRKTLEKNEKNDYKNSFDIVESIHKQAKESLGYNFNPNVMQSSFQRMYFETLESDNKVLKQYLREVVTRLFQFVKTNPEQTQRTAQLNKYISLLEIPHQHSQQFRQILMKLLDKTKQLIHAPKINKVDTQSLLSFIEQMKFCYSSCEQIEQRRSNMIRETFNLFSQRQKLNQPCLQRITKYLNQPNSIGHYDFQARNRVYEEARLNFQQQKNQSRKSIDYFRQKFEFLKKQSSMVHLLEENINNLVEPSENTYNLME